MRSNVSVRNASIHAATRLESASVGSCCAYNVCTGARVLRSVQDTTTWIVFTDTSGASPAVPSVIPCLARDSCTLMYKSHERRRATAREGRSQVASRSTGPSFRLLDSPTLVHRSYSCDLRSFRLE